LVRGIADVFCKAIEAFRRNNQGRSPVRIIVYRSDPGGRGALNTLVRDLFCLSTSSKPIVCTCRPIMKSEQSVMSSGRKPLLHLLW